MSELRDPEFRRDPVTGRWVIVAPERSLRPMTLEGAEPRHRPDGEGRPCPFCPGHEYDTPHEVFAVREPGSAPDGPGWRLRVVPNKYPAVKPQTDLSPTRSLSGEGQLRPGGLSPSSFPGKGDGGFSPSPFEQLPGIGRHEVVIESPDHVSNPAFLPDDQIRDVFLAYRERLVALAADPDLQFAAVFKNVGAEAGASLGHCHSQIVATPLVPDIVRQELNGAGEYHTRTGRCVFCDIVRHELADGRRVVAETPHFLAVTAFAGRFAYEIWVLPKAHGSRYEAAAGPVVAELAGLMKRVVRGLDAVLDGPAYNWFLHTAPLRSAELGHYHWHFEVMPRTSRPAGFEWGTGCYVNAVAPETAAAQLRAACPG
ncbi:MAG: galT [Gemmataceae bacterium]|nr:galT [Gemmataceae bacterium]